MIHPLFYAKVKPSIDKCSTFAKHMFSNELKDLILFLSCCFSEDIADETDADFRKIVKVMASMFVFSVLENIDLSLDFDLLINEESKERIFHDEEDKKNNNILYSPRRYFKNIVDS